MLKYTINKVLDLRFEDEKTNIYVNNRLFMHCKYILLNITPYNTEEITRINSIDEIVENLDRSTEFSRIKLRHITPEMEFWVHCSNLQAWYENRYNTCLIHSNLAFPLLKELAKAGDLIAREMFKEEVAKRFESQNLGVIQFSLYNNYLDYFNKEELECFFSQIKGNLTELLITQLKVLLISFFTEYRKIKELIEIILFIDLKYNQNMALSIFNDLNENLRKDFAQILILHLNYKEGIDYKLPYGKFFCYFESFLNYIWDKYPEIKDLLKLIDSGFLSGALPLDEMLSYGSESYRQTIY